MTAEQNAAFTDLMVAKLATEAAAAAFEKAQAATATKQAIWQGIQSGGLEAAYQDWYATGLVQLDVQAKFLAATNAQSQAVAKFNAAFGNPGPVVG